MGLGFLDAHSFFPGCLRCDLALLAIKEQCVVDCQIPLDGGKFSGGLVGAKVELVGLEDVP